MSSHGILWADAILRPPVRSLVSMRRQLATVFMTMFALVRLPAGDLVETGVFHGGTTVLMARVLHNLSSSRVLWACDSFKGLPRAQAQDSGNCSWLPGLSGRSGSVRRRSCGRGTLGRYTSPRSTVERALHAEHLSQYVRIVPGWFHETLPPHGLTSIAFLRLDGDTFNGTYEALQRLYPRVVKGGIVYVDDAGSFRGAAVALDAYFGYSIGVPIQEEEGYYDAVWWRKGGSRYVDTSRHNDVLSQLMELVD